MDVAFDGCSSVSDSKECDQATPSFVDKFNLTRAREEGVGGGVVFFLFIVSWECATGWGRIFRLD